MNSWIGIGRWTRDFEGLKYSQSGTAIASNTLAVDRPPRQGQEKQADFVKCVMFGKTAENVSQYSGKGRLVAVQGSLQIRNYDDKDGNKRTVAEVVANTVQFLDYPKDERPAQEHTQGQAYEPGDDDDLGF